MENRNSDLATGAAELVMKAQLAVENGIRNSIDAELDGAVTGNEKAKKIVEDYKAKRDEAKKALDKEREVRDRSIELAKASFDSKVTYHNETMKQLNSQLKSDLGKVDVIISVKDGVIQAENVVLAATGTVIGHGRKFFADRFAKIQRAASQVK